MILWLTVAKIRPGKETFSKKKMISFKMWTSWKLLTGMQILMTCALGNIF